MADDNQQKQDIQPPGPGEAELWRLTEQDDPAGLSRRQFFLRLGLGSIAVAGLGTAVFAYQFLSPNVLYEPSPVVNMGRPEGYAPESVTLDPAAGIYMVRSAEGFYAISAVCTHLGCLTAWRPEQDIIACPCHGSQFDKNGKKTAGPAPRNLPWLSVWLNDDGDLMVDRSATIPARQYVKV